MTRLVTRTRRSRPAQPDGHVYLPHSSWARVERKPASSVPIAADDFWARLGI
ncbi:hypothetical protein [Sphingobium lactosutens]|uniref:hypothetical protein n=1 Tax=Sphingobium lactosutens TaxID=522773 RepID=UPI0015BBBA53|nr:hypothetical protein [Sphingobium lactosutens]